MFLTPSMTWVCTKGGLSSIMPCRSFRPFSPYEYAKRQSRGLEAILWCGFIRKELIRQQVPLQPLCYDFTPVNDPFLIQVYCNTFKYSSYEGFFNALSNNPHLSKEILSQSVTGDVYKAQVQIHRAMLIHDYWQFHLHEVELQTSIRTVIMFHALLRLASLHQIVITIVARL